MKFSVYLNRRVFVMRKQLVSTLWVWSQTSTNIIEYTQEIPQSWEAPKESKIIFTIRIWRWWPDALWKHTCSNILKNFITRKWKFSDKKIWYFYISAQSIDCRYSLEPPRWDGSNVYLQSMLLSRNKENNVYPCKRKFYYIKRGLMGVKTVGMFSRWATI